MSTNIIFQPSMTFQEILDQAQVIATDGTQWTRINGGWMIVGIGIGGLLVEPFTESEMRGKMIDATDLGFIPDLDGNDVIIVKGYDRLKSEVQ